MLMRMYLRNMSLIALIRIRVPHDRTLDSSTQNAVWNVNECNLIFKFYYFWKMHFLRITLGQGSLCFKWKLFYINFKLLLFFSMGLELKNSGQIQRPFRISHMQDKWCFAPQKSGVLKFTNAPVASNWGCFFKQYEVIHLN